MRSPSARCKRSPPPPAFASLALRRGEPHDSQRCVSQAGGEQGRVVARLGRGGSVMIEYDELFQSVKVIAQSLQALNQQAVQQYTPVVGAIIGERCQDTAHIEHTLDGLLDFAHDPQALVLY